MIPTKGLWHPQSNVDVAFVWIREDKTYIVLIFSDIDKYANLLYM